MSITLSALQKQRRDTAANWTAENPTLLAGEIGLESDTGYWKVGDGATAWTSLAYVTGLGAEIPVSRLADGTARQLLQTAANGTDVEWTSNVDVPGTLDVTGAATFDAGVTIQGDLTVNGTTTTIDTQNLIVEDKNVVIGQVTTPTDVTADGGGITLKGSTDKTINWVDATDAWTSSERFSVPLGSAAAPTLTFTGDTTTGIYNASGSLAISTSGTGRLFVDASGNVEVAGTAKRIRGDFSNATHANRLSFQTSVVDGSTSPFLIPNGTGSAAQAIVCNSSDPTNSAFLSLGCFGGAINEARINSAILGTGTQLPLTFHVGGERLRITSTGNVGIGTTSPSTLLHVAGIARVGADDTSNAVLEIGAGATGDRNAFIDLTGDTTYADYGLRLVRNAGANNNSVILHRGTGFLGLNAQDVAPITFSTINTERARIDSSGRLLVGTSSALEVESGFSDVKQQIVAGDTFASFRYEASAAYVASWFCRSRNATTGQHTVLQANDGIARFNFQGSDGTKFVPAARIEAAVDGTPGANDMPGRLVFSTTADGASSPTEHMRIGQNGFVYLYTTTQFPGSGNTAVGGMFERASSSDGASFFLSRGASVALFLNRNSDGAVSNFNRSGTTVGSIVVSTTGTGYNTTSDYRLKENVTVVTDGINRLQQLKPSRFNFIADPDKTVDGFLAHEAQAVVPECVTGEKDAVDDDGNPVYQGIDQSKLVPLLTAALQEAVAKIESLEARLTAAGI